MAVTENKYQLGTAETRNFCRMLEMAISFFFSSDISFRHQEEAPIILEMTALPGKTVTVKPGSQAV